jgi:hypothetical protein
MRLEKSGTACVYQSKHRLPENDKDTRTAPSNATRIFRKSASIAESLSATLMLPWVATPTDMGIAPAADATGSKADIAAQTAPAGAPREAMKAPMGAIRAR